MPSYLVIHNAETLANLMEKCDRPSPVSVLDQCFSEDIISPHSTSVEYGMISNTPNMAFFS